MRSTSHAAQRRLPKDFWNWFGDSKIVDEDGFPKIVFHGTLLQFVDFRSRKRNPELGFHFGSLPQAEFFAGSDGERTPPTGSNIRPVYLRIRSPLRLYDVFERGRRSAENVAKWMCRDGLISTCVRDQVNCARSARQANERIAWAIRDIGCDGIVYENDHEGGTDTTNDESYVVFEAAQIRSMYQ